jgi:hypothetical protein
MFEYTLIETQRCQDELLIAFSPIKLGISNTAYSHLDQLDLNCFDSYLDTISHITEQLRAKAVLEQSIDQGEPFFNFIMVWQVGDDISPVGVLAETFIEIATFFKEV